MSITNLFKHRKNINFVNIQMKEFNHQKHRWDSETSLVNKKKHNIIFYGDFCTFDTGICKEIEQYVEKDLAKYCTFIVPNYGIEKLYPLENIIYYNNVLYKNSLALDTNKNRINPLIKPVRYKKWLCLNRLYKPHRSQTLFHLRYYKDVGVFSNWQQGVDPEFGITNPDYQYRYNNVSNFINLIENYNKTRLSIVTESRYNDDYPFVTEKTLHAFVAGHAVLPISSKGFIAHCKQLGFKFESYLNLDYDTSEHPVRIIDAINSNKHLLDYKPISVKNIEHNRNTAYNLHRVILQDFQDKIKGL